MFLVASAVSTRSPRGGGRSACSAAWAPGRATSPARPRRSGAARRVGTALGIPWAWSSRACSWRASTESTELVFSLTLFRSALEVSPGALAVGAGAGLAARSWPRMLPGRAATASSPLAALGGAAPPGGAALARAGRVPAAVAGRPGRFRRPGSGSFGRAGNVAALAADVALVCVFMRLAGVCARVVGSVAKPFGFAARLALDRLAPMPDQLALARGVLALGLGLVILAGTFARSFEESVLDFIRRQVRADLVVASTATTGWIESPVTESRRRLAAVPGVARVERLRLAEYEHHGERISVDSLETAAFAPGREATSFSRRATPPALAAVRGAAPPSSRATSRACWAFASATSSPRRARRALDPPVAGIVSTTYRRGQRDPRAPGRRRWWRDRTVNRFHVWLSPGAAADAVRRAIAAGIGRPEGLKVLTHRELYAYHRDAVRRAFRLRTRSRCCPCWSPASGWRRRSSPWRSTAVASSRSSAPPARRAVRSLAPSSRRPRPWAGSGSSAGSPSASLLSMLWVRVNFPCQLGWEMALHLSLGSLSLAALAAALVSVPASLLPARRISRLPVLDALRGE